MTQRESLVGLLDRSRKRLAVALGIALFLHLPLTPALSIFKLAHRFSMSREASKPPPARELEVELQDALNDEQKRVESRDIEAPSKAPSVQIESRAPLEVAKPEAKPGEAGNTPKAGSDPSAPAPSAELARKKIRQLRLEGDLAVKSGSKPGAMMGLWFSSLRHTLLGQELGNVAACNREWKGFIDQGIDVMNDIDAVLVVGPDLFNPARLTVAVGHALSAERVHGVMDALVQHSGAHGSWLRPNVAAARLGRRHRVLVASQQDLFFVAPRKGWEALDRMTAPVRVPPADGRAASVVLGEPNRVLDTVGLTLPKSISQLRLELFANRDQSLDLKLELEAKTAKAAQLDADAIAEQMRDFVDDVWTATSALGTFAGTHTPARHREPSPRLDLTLDGQTLSGMLHLSAEQTRATLSLLSSLACKQQQRRVSSAAPRAAR
jgi:hypothetical protein